MRLNKVAVANFHVDAPFGPGGAGSGRFAPFNPKSPFVSGLFAGHNSTRGSDQQVLKILRFESGRVRGGVRNLTGRLVSGQEVFSSHGSVRVALTRSDWYGIPGRVSTRENPWFFQCLPPAHRSTPPPTDTELATVTKCPPGQHPINSESYPFLSLVLALVSSHHILISCLQCATPALA